MSASGWKAAMSWALRLSWVVLAACGFQIAPGVADAPPLDVPDAPPDVPDGRVRTGLIGFWTFDDPPGATMLADTSGTMPPVPLEVFVDGIPPPMITNGNVVADVPVRLHTALNTRLPTGCTTGGGVTLEAWVMPRANVQGQPNEPSFIVGLAFNVSSRNVALLQNGDKWMGLVRTTAALDGEPRLQSTSFASSTSMTHLVLTGSPSQRILYVNGVPEAEGVAGPLTGWDATYPLAVLDEYQHARQWTGTVAMIALYNRGLSASEIAKNFALGPNAP